jgi:hypothetical protein
MRNNTIAEPKEEKTMLVNSGSKIDLTYPLNIRI